MWGYGLDRSGSAQGRGAGTCECGNEPSGSIKCGELLDWLRTGQFLKQDSVSQSQVVWSLLPANREMLFRGTSNFENAHPQPDQSTPQDKGNSNNKSLAYMSIVRPILEYGAACWDPYREGQISALDRVQKKAAKFAHHANSPNWETLASRRKLSRICGVHCCFLLQMPDFWVEVSIRKVLRPATSTQVFLGFPVPKSKC